MKKITTYFIVSVLLMSCSKDDSTKAPDAPIIGIAIAGDEMAKITFTTPLNDGGSVITEYMAISTPENIVGVLQETESDTIFVNGLTNGKEYSFTVKATNAVGTSKPSAVSNTVTPKLGPDWYYNCYPVYDSWGYYLYDDCYWEYY